MIAETTATAMMAELRRAEQLAQKLTDENIQLRTERDALRGAVRYLESQRDIDRTERLNGHQR